VYDHRPDQPQSTAEGRSPPAGVDRHRIEARVHARPGRLDADGALVGHGDLAAQVEQSHPNVAAAVAGAGGSFDNVAKLTIYITDWSIDKMPAVEEGRNRAFAKLEVTSLAPGTLIGLAALFTPDHLVEIEAIAVID